VTRKGKTKRFYDVLLNGRKTISGPSSGEGKRGKRGTPTCAEPFSVSERTGKQEEREGDHPTFPSKKKQRHHLRKKREKEKKRQRRPSTQVAHILPTTGKGEGKNNAPTLIRKSIHPKKGNIGFSHSSG